MKISLSNFEIMNIIGYVNNEDSIVVNTAKKFSVTFVWAFRNNIKTLLALNESINQLDQEIMDYYADDEYSYTNEDGIRVVKNEYLGEFNNKRLELFNQVNDVEIQKVKLNKLVPGGIDALDDVGVSIRDMDMLSFMIDDPE